MLNKITAPDGRSAYVKNFGFNAIIIGKDLYDEEEGVSLPLSGVNIGRETNEYNGTEIYI